MFRITRISDGECLGLTEAPNYIKQSEENGCFILCPEPEASGIAFDGVPYQLLGRPPMEGTEDMETVMLDTVDIGEMFQRSQSAYPDLDAMAVDHEYRLTLLELGLAANSETV